MVKRSARKKQSDMLYNARRRILREAAREEKKGNIEHAAELRSQAESYKAKNVTKGIRRNDPAYAAAISRAAQKATSESKKYLKSRKDREKLAHQILRGNAGAQFFASTVELWHRPGEVGASYEQRYKRIIEGMGATDLLDAIEKLEAGANVSLVDAANAPTSERYDTLVVRSGMLYVSNL